MTVSFAPRPNERDEWLRYWASAVRASALSGEMDMYRDDTLVEALSRTYGRQARALPQPYSTPPAARFAPRILPPTVPASTWQHSFGARSIRRSVVEDPDTPSPSLTASTTEAPLPTRDSLPSASGDDESAAPIGRAKPAPVKPPPTRAKDDSTDSLKRPLGTPSDHARGKRLYNERGKWTYEGGGIGGQRIERRFSAPAVMRSVYDPVEPINDVVMAQVPAGAKPGVDRLRVSSSTGFMVVAVPSTAKKGTELVWELPPDWAPPVRAPRAREIARDRARSRA